MPYRGPADGVFEGGGAKGIALVGALEVARHYVTEWRSLAGTSAGAIVAALLAAEYTPDAVLGLLAGQGIPGVVKPFKLSDLPRRRALGGLPVLSPLVNLFAHLGLYSGDFFHEVMETALAKGPRPVRTFGELRAAEEDVRDGHPPYRLQFIATDLTHRRAVIIPQGLRDLGLEPDDVPVALGVRMSMSIPLYFEPVVLPTKPPTVVVDGGFVSNFPIWLFDSKSLASWPTFGFLLDERKEFTWELRGVGQLARRVVDTAMGALNDVLLERGAEVERVVRIDVSGYSTIEFNMGQRRMEELLRRGREAARRFFEAFDPARYENSRGRPLAPEAQRMVAP